MNKYNKQRIRSKVLETENFSRPHNFLYRLVSSQRFLAFIGLVFLLLIVIPLVRTRNQQRLISKEIAEAEAEIKNFENQSREFQELGNYLKSQQSLEERARLNLNLKKSGEQLIVVNTEGVSGDDFSSVPESQLSNFKKWWNYFFSL